MILYEGLHSCICSCCMMMYFMVSNTPSIIHFPFNCVCTELEFRVNSESLGGTYWSWCRLHSNFFYHSTLSEQPFSDSEFFILLFGRNGYRVSRAVQACLIFVLFLVTAPLQKCDKTLTFSTSVWSFCNIPVVPVRPLTFEKMTNLFLPWLCSITLWQILHDWLSPPQV